MGKKIPPAPPTKSSLSTVSSNSTVAIARKNLSQEEISGFIDWEAELGVTSESIDDDIKGTDEVKLFTRLHKTDEEISRLTMIEDLDDIKRITILLRTGQNIQLPCVISSLPKLLRDHRKETLSVIIPLILETLPTRTTDFQIMAASAFYELIENGCIPESSVDVLHQCASKLLSSKDEDVSGVWGDVLIVSIKYMSQKEIYESILPGCLAYSGISQPVPLRIWSCRMLGAVISRLKIPEIESLFQRAIALCQDTDYEVRACMCHQLNEFVKHLKLDTLRRSLFHEYVELIMDEEDFVREAGLANVVKLIEFVDDSVKLNIIVPIWRKLCLEKPVRLMELMARDFGAFFYHSKAVLLEENTKFFVDFYIGLIYSPEDDLRLWSAYNFPGVLKSVGPQSYELFKLDQALSHLSTDPNFEVRRHISCGFHEIVEILDRQSQSLLRQIFLRLLSDSELDVYEPLFKNLNVVLKGFALDESGRKTAQFDELLFSILRKEREYASNPGHKLTWRIHHALLTQFKYFIDYFDSEYIHDQCVPLLFKLLSDNVTMPIKHVVIETLCIYLKKMRRLENRIKIIRSIADLRESPTYHNRLLFMWILKALYSEFSHHFMRETFFDEFLDMARDTVPNIRFTFVELSSLFRGSLIRGYQQTNGTPGSGIATPSKFAPSVISSQQQQQYQAAAMANITRLNECLMSLCGDQDRDVASAAQDELEKLGVGSRRTVKALAAGIDELEIDSVAMRAYGLSEAQVLEDKEREEFEERLFASEVDEDSMLSKKRDDDMSMSRTDRIKRLSLSSKPIAIKGIQSGSHRKTSVPVKPTVAPTKPLNPPPVLQGPGSTIQRNRVSLTNHGSLTQLPLGTQSAQVVEVPKRGKSAGPMGKGKATNIIPNSSAKGILDDQNYAVGTDLSRKKSIGSLIPGGNTKGGTLKIQNTNGSNAANATRKDTGPITTGSKVSPTSSRTTLGRTISVNNNPGDKRMAGSASPQNRNTNSVKTSGVNQQQLPPISHK